MKFSQKKFSQFTPSKQEKVIAELILLLEKEWLDTSKREELLVVLKNCLKWTSIAEMVKTGNSLQGIHRLEDFLKIMVPWEQRYSRELRDHDFLILQRDGDRVSNKTLELTVILHDLRSAFNVGNIIRTAECLGVDKLIFSGYTPSPTNKKVQETSMGTCEFIQWEKTDDLPGYIEDLKKKGIKIYGLETTTHARDIFKSEIDAPAALILGNEALGVPRDILELCDSILEIPTGGWKNSLNVGVAFAVAGYEILRKWNYRD